MRKARFVAVCMIVALLVALAGGAVVAQQATTDIWKLVPPNSLVVAAFDTRPDNASIQAIMNAQDPQTRDLLAKQNIAIRKAIEDFATLFGVSLDFAKDIDPWQDQQWAFVLLPGEKKEVQPVFLIASKDATAAGAALQKMLEPWARLGELTPEPDQDFPITAFRTKDKGIEVYASAYRAVVAVACSKDALKQALRGGGFAAGSTADKALNALSGSMFYAYADASLLNSFGVKPEAVPINGVGVGVSAIDTGMKLRVIGYPSEGGVTILKQMLAEQQTGSLVANPGVPATSLVAASFPNLAGPVAMAGAAGLAKMPIFSAAVAASKMQISAAMTAVFPRPAWVISGMADSPEAAAAARTEIESGLRKGKVVVQPFAPGVSSIKLSDDCLVYLSQTGKHVLLADDVHSLNNASAVISNTQPSIVQSKVYQETMSGLADSNLLTVYANLAPIQGLGFLAEGLGVNQWGPVYDSFAKSVQNVQSMGIGAGFDGQVANVTIFLRAKPGMAPTIGPAAIAGTAVGAAILFPAIKRAQNEAKDTECINNMKLLTLAARAYARAHGGKLPIAANWRTQLKPYLPTIDEMQCANAKIVYNKNLSGISIKSVQYPERKVMFFEANPGFADASGSLWDADLPHDGQGIFAFVDTHVEELCDVPGGSQWLPYVKKGTKKAPVSKRRH